MTESSAPYAAPLHCSRCGRSDAAIYRPAGDYLCIRCIRDAAPPPDDGGDLRAWEVARHGASVSEVAAERLLASERARAQQPPADGGAMEADDLTHYMDATSRARLLLKHTRAQRNVWQRRAAAAEAEVERLTERLMVAESVGRAGTADNARLRVALERAARTLHTASGHAQPRWEWCMRGICDDLRTTLDAVRGSAGRERAEWIARAASAEAEVARLRAVDSLARRIFGVIEGGREMAQKHGYDDALVILAHKEREVLRLLDEWHALAGDGPDAANTKGEADAPHA